MKKKVILIVVIILIVIALVIAGIMLSNANDLEKKASKEFGDEYCDAIVHISTKDLVIHNCKICGKEFQDSSMREDICDDCALKTNRCNFCGKKLTEEIKQERNSMLNGTNIE